MATVYIWKTKGTRVGHCTLQYRSGYISFWPTKEGKKFWGWKKSVSYSASSYNEDKHEYGREADDKVTIHNLNEEAIDKYWKNAKSEDFNLFKKNCSTIVANALRKGYLQSSIRFKKIKLAKLYMPSNWSGTSSLLVGETIAWTPVQTLEFAKALKRISQ